jgi:hypothetical protein
MIGQFKEISDALASALKVFSILIPAYIVALGLARRAGKQLASKRRIRKWKAQGLPRIRLFWNTPQTIPAWKDPAVLSGGLTGLVTILFWMSFVLIGLLIPIFLPNITDPNLTVPELVARLIFFPNLMIGLNIAIRAWISRSGTPTFLSIAAFTCFLLSTGAIIWVNDSQREIIIQLLIFLVLSFIMSFNGGMSEGLFEFSSPDLFAYPMVEVVLKNDKTMNLVRLYQTTPTDYRFIRDDGVELILPSQQIAEIRYHPTAYLEKSEENNNFEKQIDS